MNAPSIALHARIRFKAWWLPQVPTISGTVMAVNGVEIRVRPATAAPDEREHWISREAVVEVLGENS